MSLPRPRTLAHILQSQPLVHTHMCDPLPRTLTHSPVPHMRHTHTRTHTTPSRRPLTLTPMTHIRTHRTHTHTHFTWATGEPATDLTSSSPSVSHQRGSPRHPLCPGVDTGAVALFSIRSTFRLPQLSQNVIWSCFDFQFCPGPSRGQEQNSVAGVFSAFPPTCCLSFTGLSFLLLVFWKMSHIMICLFVSSRLGSHWVFSVSPTGS